MFSFSIQWLVNCRADQIGYKPVLNKKKKTEEINKDKYIHVPHKINAIMVMRFIKFGGKPK